MQHLGRAAPDVFSSAIIAGSRRYLRVSGKLLDGADIDAEVEQVADERAAENELAVLGSSV